MNEDDGIWKAWNEALEPIANIMEPIADMMEKIMEPIRVLAESLPALRGQFQIWEMPKEKTLRGELETTLRQIEQIESQLDGEWEWELATYEISKARRNSMREVLKVMFEEIGREESGLDGEWRGELIEDIWEEW